MEEFVGHWAPLLLAGDDEPGIKPVEDTGDVRLVESIGEKVLIAQLLKRCETVHCGGVGCSFSGCEPLTGR